MIRIAVVEDEDKWANIIEECLDKLSKQDKIDIAITRFCDGYDLVENFACNFDIILMDIEMPLMNGMEAAEKIRNVDSEVTIIFITNMAQYAIRGYKVNALDYILKPISYIPFSETIKKAVRIYDKDKGGFIVISHKGGTEKIMTDNIYYIESQGHRLTFHTSKGTYETTTYSMKEIEQILSSYSFKRCNSGCLVNLKYVTGYNGNELKILNTAVSISRGKKNDFLAALASYMSE